jgi:hypothetical protein
VSHTNTFHWLLYSQGFEDTVGGIGVKANLKLGEQLSWHRCDIGDNCTDGQVFLQCSGQVILRLSLKSLNTKKATQDDPSTFYDTYSSGNGFSGPDITSPLFVDSNLVLAPQIATIFTPAPQGEGSILRQAATLSCPHCGHPSTIDTGQPSQRVSGPLGDSEPRGAHTAPPSRR